MINVNDKMCSRNGRSKRLSFGLARSSTAEVCSQYVEGRMVDAEEKMCSHDGCAKQLSFGSVRGRNRVFPSQHTERRMVNVEVIIPRRLLQAAVVLIGGKQEAAVMQGARAEDVMVNVRCGKTPGWQLGVLRQRQVARKT